MTTPETASRTSVNAPWFTGGWIQTFTGRKFYPLAPRIEDICIEDIAHALSNICRYGGHCNPRYSVAQHCCMVSDFLPDFKLEGLLHDATEAYLGDVVKPIKHSSGMSGYRQAEHYLDALIHTAFNLDLSTEVAEFVKQYDTRALFTERKLLFKNPSPDWTQEVEPFPLTKKFCAWKPPAAKRQFLFRFRTLTAGIVQRVYSNGRLRSE